MKTDALITMLASGPVRADAGLTNRRLATAAGAGLVVATVAMLLGLGPRPDLAAAASLPMFWLKLAIPLVVAGAAFAAASRLARPGDSARAAGLITAALIVVLWTSAAIVVAASPAGERETLVAGSSALPCVVSIALLSLPLFVAAFFALRGLAPTRLAAAGLAAGALAGGTAAAVYAVHCNETTLPFLAVWYVLGMTIPAGAGAWLGPRLLRWR